MWGKEKTGRYFFRSMATIGIVVIGIVVLSQWNRVPKIIGSAIFSQPQSAIAPPQAARVEQQSSAPQGANSEWKWSDVVTFANHSRNAYYGRECDPDQKYCRTYIRFTGDDNLTHFVIEGTDINSTIINRTICKDNITNDRSTCTDFDTDKVHDDMLDTKTGKWIIVPPAPSYQPPF